MNEKARAAFAAYGVSGANFTLLRHNENAIYRVEAMGKEYALRLHIPVEGFDLALFSEKRHSRGKIEGEMRLISAFSDGGFRVQRPVANRRGELVTDIDAESCATLLEWLRASRSRILTTIPRAARARLPRGCTSFQGGIPSLARSTGTRMTNRCLTISPHK